MLSVGAEWGCWVALRGPRRHSLYQHHQISSHQLIHWQPGLPRPLPRSRQGGASGDLGLPGPVPRFCGLTAWLTVGPRAAWFWSSELGRVPGSRPRVQLGCLSLGRHSHVLLQGRRGLVTPGPWQLPAVSKASSHPVALVGFLQQPCRTGQGWLTPFYRPGSRGPRRSHSWLHEPV